MSDLIAYLLAFSHHYRRLVAAEIGEREAQRLFERAIAAAEPVEMKP